MADGGKTKSGGGGQQPTTAQIGNKTARERYKTGQELYDQQRRVLDNINDRLKKLGYDLWGGGFTERGRLANARAEKLHKEEIDTLKKRWNNVERSYRKILNRANATGKVKLDYYNMGIQRDRHVRIRTNG